MQTKLLKIIWKILYDRIMKENNPRDHYCTNGFPLDGNKYDSKILWMWGSYITSSYYTQPSEQVLEIKFLHEASI